MSLTSVIDTAFDRTIAIGYGSVGRIARRHPPGWPPDPPRMDGKLVLVTGAASGRHPRRCRAPAASGMTVAAVRPRRARSSGPRPVELDAPPSAFEEIAPRYSVLRIAARH